MINNAVNEMKLSLQQISLDFFFTDLIYVVDYFIFIFSFIKLFLRHAWRIIKGQNDRNKGKEKGVLKMNRWKRMMKLQQLWVLADLVAVRNRINI